MGHKLQTDHGPFGPASSQEMGNKEFGVKERLMGYKSQTDQAPFGHADPQEMKNKEIWVQRRGL